MNLFCLIAWFLLGPLWVYGETIGHVTRDYFGDIFSLEDCQPGSCERNGRRAAEIPGETCRCQCAPSHYTFREDMRQCIKDVGECPVAMFVRPFAVERIPLVFLPMTGQLVYPGAHLTVSGIARLAPTKHLSCNVKASLLMTSHGWQPIRTMTQIFGVYYDGNKTFLQWLGNDDDRRNLQHHLVLIRLQCEGENNNGTFEPCAALRIGWAPGLEPEFGEQTSSRNNFIIIGLCLGILGLIYVGAVLIYLKVRKNRRQAARQNGSQENTFESIEEANCEIRNAYINNLVQEAEFTTKSSKHSTTENGMKTFDSSRRKSDPGANHKSNGQSAHADNISGTSDSPEDISVVQPPPQEFFVRIRGMIAAAKNRLNSFRYKPTLLVIPEDDYFYQDFKEKDGEASGGKKSNSKKFSKKGNSSAMKKMESIHGSNLGAAMLEAKLAPPQPPPRNLKPKNKKRAPSPPGETPLPENPSPISLKEHGGGGSLDRKNRRRMSQGSAENYSKFDLFRLDLYEKIHRLREESPVAENDVVLEYSDCKRPSKDDEVFASESSNAQCSSSKDTSCESYSVQYASIQQDNKISRRHLLHKLQEAESTGYGERTEKHALSKASVKHSYPSSENDEDGDDDWAPSQSGSVAEGRDGNELNGFSLNSRPGTAMSNSSARTTSSQPSTMKENKPVIKEAVEEEQRDNMSDYSETSEASLSGDSLNSSFRKPQKSPAALKVKKIARSTEDLSVISGSSAITSSTAIKEIDDYDDSEEYDDEDAEEEEEEEIEDDATQDDDSRLSTDLDAEMYSLDESEHPSLEEYLQLSTQVAKKLSERTVPVFSSDSPKEKNVISQFMKEFKTTIGRLKTTEEGKPRTSRNISPGSDNWTLKKEEKRAKVARRVSIFKRNPLKGRKNEEPLVDEEKSGYYDINIAAETDDTRSSRSSTSSMSGKKNRQRYKVKTPEIIPATKVVDGGEKTVISISNEMNQNGGIELRESARYTPSPVSKPGMPKIGKAVTPPLPPPKPLIDTEKIKTLKSLKRQPDKAERNETDNSTFSNGTNGITENNIQAIIPQNTEKRKNSKRHPRYVRTPSIESDSISVANSDMTEDSLNTPVPDEESEINPEDISEDENGPIDRCLAQLADSVIHPTDDCSLNRYLSQLGTVLAAREDLPIDQCLNNKLANNINANRATKGFNVSLHLPLCTWEHVCVDKTSDRSTPTSDRSSTTSRGSHGSQENLRKKTLNKSKHHHHHHRSSECKHSNGDLSMSSLDSKLSHILNGHHHMNGNDPFSNHMKLERTNHRSILKSKHRIASTSEEEECGRASSLGSTRELEPIVSETTSDPGSADLERPRKKRPLLRRSKKGLNGTCRQHIQNSKFNKKEISSIKKNGFQHRNSSTPRSSGSDVTVIQLEGDPHEHVTTVESTNTFVTLINVDSSDCSNSAEEK